MSPLLGIFSSSIKVGSEYWMSYLASSRAASSQYDYGYGIRADSLGNTYSAIGYMNTSGGWNNVITKYNSVGTLQWQKSLLGPTAAASQYDINLSVNIDASDNFYIAGGFKNSSGGENGFFAKYNSSGTLQWQRSISGPAVAASQYEIIYNIYVDTSGNLYTGGYFKNSSGGQNAFITKYDSSATLQWQRSLADSNAAASQFDITEGICTDSSGNVYVTGYFKNASGFRNIFVAKYNSSGTIQWQKSLTAGFAADFLDDAGMKIATDTSNNVYICGYYATSTGLQNIFLIKYDTSGTVQWQKKLSDSGSNDARGYGIFIDSSNNIYVSGSCTLSGNLVGFFAKYDVSGALQLQRSIAGPSASKNDNCVGIFVDSSNKIYLNGYFKNTSGGTNVFSARLPGDGSKIGTYTFDASHSLTYSSSSIVSSTGILTSSAGSLTSATSSLTTSTSSLTESTSSLTSGLVSL